MSDVGGIGWLRPGARLIGKYEIVRPIGRGGFGLVYEARHLGLRAPVAIKVLRSEGRQQPQTLERFRREAWASTQIASPHVVRLTDVDVLEDGTPFLVMELLSGRDLEAELAARGRLPIHEAIGYVLQAASAIAEAHARGVVHRDLKPNNLFLAEQGGSRSIKVLDFGLSKIASELSVTKTSAQLGTPLYMSPEQLRSAKHVDGRSDIWSLGVILYRLLALRTPFDGQTATDVMVAIMSQSPPELSQLAPHLPPELARAVMKTLRKNPAERFQTVADLAQALAPFGPPGVFIGPAAVPFSAPQLGPSATLTDSSQDTPTEPAPSRTRAWLTTAAAALSIVLASAAVRAWWISAATHAANVALREAAAPAAVTPAAAPSIAPAPAVVASPNLPQAVPSASASATPAQRHAPKAHPATPQSLPAKASPKRDLGF